MKKKHNEPGAMIDLILGIDPGKSGGLAWRYDGGKVACAPMPRVEAEIPALIEELAGADDLARVAYIEKVGGYVGQPQPGSRMFTFGRNTGVILGALYSNGFRIIEVAPSVWQKEIGVAGIEAKKRKAELKNRAHQLFPTLKKQITLKTSDALLIFEYACRAHKAKAF
jgi:hypothetical protein